VTVKVRSVSYIGMSDLLTREEVETFSQVVDVSFGDSRYTLISYRDFMDCLESVCTDARRCEVTNAYFNACTAAPTINLNHVYIDLEG
jgi:hypothetical protein